MQDFINYKYEQMTTIMKKKFLLFSLVGLVALSGCQNGDTEGTTDKEAATRHEALCREYGHRYLFLHGG